jgi:membrane protease YdiL (CAAX protease family)
MSSLGEIDFTTLREWRVAIVGVVIALFGLDLLDFVLPDVSATERPLRWVLLVGPHWLVMAAVLAIVVWVERRRLTSIGLKRPTLHDLGWGVVGFVVGVLTFAVSRPLVELLGLSATGSGIQTLASLPVGIVVALAVTAGIAEEVLFRGYPIERLAALTGNIWVGAVLTFVVFTVAHIPFWGLGGALQIGGWTVVVTVLYVRRRNLPACILMHICNDLFAFVLLPYLFEVGGAVA